MDDFAPSQTSTQNVRGKLDKASGASLVEYALLIGLVATIGILAIRSLGQTVSGQFSTATGIITGG